MSTLLNDFSVVNDHDAICVDDGRQPVRDDERGSVFAEPAQGALDFGLGFGVNSTGRLLQ